MSRLVIVGSTGFIGQKILDYATSQEVSLVGLDLSGSYEGFKFFNILNSSDNPYLPGDVVLFLAAVSSDGMFLRDPLTGISTNVHGAIRSLEMARQANAKRFVFCSTEWVYGDKIHKLVNEDDDPNFLNLTSEYAKSKLLVESYIKGLADNFMTITVARLGIVVGQRRQSGSALEKIVADLEAHGTVTVGSAQTARRYIYVDHVAKALFNIAYEESAPPIVHLTGNTLISIGEIVSKYNEITGKETVIIEQSATNHSVRNVASKYNYISKDTNSLYEMLMCQLH